MTVSRRTYDAKAGCSTTHPNQRPSGEQCTFQGREVIAVQHGTCMHCRCDLTSLLVGAGAARKWINTETWGPRDVEHSCSRSPT